MIESIVTGILPRILPGILSEILPGQHSSPLGGGGGQRYFRLF